MAPNAPKAPNAYQRSKKHPELFRKPGNARWFCFLPNPAGGRRLRVATGLADEQAAYSFWLSRVGSTAHPSGLAPQGPERTLVQALTARLEWLASGRLNTDPTRRKASAATIGFYAQKGLQLGRVLGHDTPLSAIGHAEIRRYIVTRTTEGVTASTISKELVTLSRAWSLARKDGVACKPFEDIVPEDFAAAYVPKTRWLSEGEVDALIAALPAHRAAVVAFIVATSATYPSEVAPVRPGDVRGDVVHLKGTKRASRDRTLRVPSHAAKYLRLAVRGLTPSGFAPWPSIRRDLHRAAKALSMCASCRAERAKWAHHDEGAGKPTGGPCKACKRAPRFERLSPNDLRRTFAQWLVRSGVPYELAYPLMGHNSPAMLQKVYGKRDATAVADLVELALKQAPRGARRAGQSTAP